MDENEYKWMKIAIITVLYVEKNNSGAWKGQLICEGYGWSRAEQFWGPRLSDPRQGLPHHTVLFHKCFADRHLSPCLVNFSFLMKIHSLGFWFHISSLLVA